MFIYAKIFNIVAVSYLSKLSNNTVITIIQDICVTGTIPGNNFDILLTVFNYNIIFQYKQPTWNQLFIFYPNLNHSHIKDMKLTIAHILEHISNTYTYTPITQYHD